MLDHGQVVRTGGELGFVAGVAIEQGRSTSQQTSGVAHDPGLERLGMFLQLERDDVDVVDALQILQDAGGTQGATAQAQARLFGR